METELLTQLHTYLSADDDLSNLIGTRLFPDIPEPNTALPCLIYTITQSKPADTGLPGNSGQVEHTLQIDLWSLTALTAAMICDLLRTALDGYHEDNLKQTTWIEQITSVDETGYHRTQQYTLRYDENSD